MPTASGRDSPRGSNADGPPPAQNGRGEQRREKSKSTQGYQQYNSSRRGSARPDDVASGAATPKRPGLQSRTHSAPLLDKRRQVSSGRPSPEGEGSGVEDSDRAGQRGAERTPEQHSPTGDGALSDGQDEDEIAGVVGAIKRLQHYQPLRSPEVSEPVQEVNIAVIGGQGVGKSTFIQKVFNLPEPIEIAAHTMNIEETAYIVRLIELDIDEIHVDDDDTVDWPEVVQDKAMPKVDGALTLYNVKDAESFEDVPTVLNAISKSVIPSILVSCQCDTRPLDRAIDPNAIEHKAKRNFGSGSHFATLQISSVEPATCKKGVSMILRAIVAGNAENHARTASANRLRAQSSAVRSLSPRPPSFHSHTRASSEYTGILAKDKDQKHVRHDSSLQTYSSTDRLNVPGDMQGSFLLEESASERLADSTDLSTQDLQQVVGGAPAPSGLSENGASFDELVDRLLAQQKSKADEKYVNMFLALYRNFAAPGRLLEAIVEHFDALERSDEASLLKTSAQLRYTTIIAHWVGTYPGDFAHPKTKRRMRTFVAKLKDMPIFGAAATQMEADLEAVQEDDDTDWAFNDKDREAQRNSAQWRNTMSSTASTLIDDPCFDFPDGIGSGDKTLAATLGTNQQRSAVASSHLTQSVDVAQRQAQLLQPIPRNNLTKIQWRALYEQPEDLVARELTRIDWILFSSIRPRDLVRHVVLSGPQKAACKNLANVTRMIDHFNQLAFWVSNFILLRDKPKHRALMLEKFMKIARKVRELNNYNSLGAIIAGVKSTSVHRLAATRELIPPMVGKDWMRLEMLMGPQKSHSPYRLAWENSSGERIPYLPLHRRDLVSAFEANKTFIGDERDERINWRKFEVVGEVIVLMQRAQGVPYKGLSGSRGNEIVRELVLDVKISKDEDELWERSLQVEPSGSSAGGGVGGSTQRLKEFFKR